MKVAILMPRATQRGGAEQLLDIFLKHVDPHALDVITVFLENGPLVRDYRAKGREVAVIPAGRLRELHNYIRTVAALRRLIRKERVDLVFSWMSKAHLYGGLSALWSGIPAIWYQHGLPKANSLMDRLITLVPAAGVVACSQHVASLQQQLWPERPTDVAHPCVDTERFDPAQLPSPNEARSELGLPQDRPVVGIVGRLQRWKGIHVFVEALDRVRRSHPDVYGVIVGGRHDLEPEYADEVANLIRKRNLQDHVLQAGYQQNVPHWMQAMDIVVHASDVEPFGMVIVEAMALGKPVVAGSAGGPREIITEGKNGLLAPFGDADALADKIMAYLTDPSCATRVGSAARGRAKDFKPDAYAARLTTLIQSYAS